MCGKISQFNKSKIIKIFDLEVYNEYIPRHCIVKKVQNFNKSNKKYIIEEKISKNKSAILDYFERKGVLSKCRGSLVSNVESDMS